MKSVYCSIKNRSIILVIIFIFILSIGSTHLLLNKNQIGVVNATKVGADIISDTTWTKAGNPYYIEKDIVVMPGATLTIKEGTEILFSSYKGLIVRGNIEALGTTNETVNFKLNQTGISGQEPWSGIRLIGSEGGLGEFRHVIIQDAMTGISFEEFYSRTDIKIEHSEFKGNGISIDSPNHGGPIVIVNISDCKFESSDTAISGVDMNIRDTTFTKLEYGLYKTKRMKVINSTFDNCNYATSSTIGTDFSSSTFIDNAIGIWGHEEKVDNCTISNCEYGIISTLGAITLTNNSIFNNRIGIELIGTSNNYHPIHYNNIFNNTKYNINLTSISSVDATYNWWGITNTTKIGQLIHDVYDDANLGEVNFKPFLNSPVISNGGITNNAPIADAGSNITVEINTSITFDGSSSYDPDGDPLSYRWNFGDDTSNVTQKVTSHSYQSPGNYIVSLVVNDGKLSDKDSIVITVTNKNQSNNSAPIAIIWCENVNISVNEKAFVSGDGSYDPDGGPLLYQWSSDIDGNIGNEMNFFSYLSLGKHTITLKVSDIFSLNGYDSVMITVVEQPPIDQDGDGVYDENDDFPTDPSASLDTDGDGYPDNWNPGKSEKDSTTGLTLDHFPNDKYRHLPEESGDDLNWVSILFITLGIIIFVFLFAIISIFFIVRKMREGSFPRELRSYKRRALMSDKESFHNNERKKLLNRKMKDGYISSETYHELEKLIEESEETNQASNIKVGKL